MAGIYIHIPFCKQACHYCNFHFSTTLHLKTKLIESIVKEIGLKQNFFSEDSAKQPVIETIYFGGGTPSLLNERELASILEALHLHFNIASNVEITLEANPDDLTKTNLKTFQSSGVNRLSIGIQSFEEEHLAFMNRAHSAKEAIECLHNSYEVGFEHLNIDLIYGLPGLTNASWEAQLNQLEQFPIDHISAYALTVEPKTALDHMIQKGKIADLNDALIADQFLMTATFLAVLGFEHYELSNYAFNQQYSKHNTAYWQGKPYLGLGPAAHSYLHPVRSWNVANNAKYINAIENQLPFNETEVLDIKDQFNEYLMTGLRTKWGIDLQYIESHFGITYRKSILDKLPQLDQNLFQTNENKITLTKRGWLWSDSILTDLIAD